MQPLCAKLAKMPPTGLVVKRPRPPETLKPYFSGT